MARNNDMTRVAAVLDVMEPAADALRGKTFCITGHMGRPRAEIEEMIRKAGGRTSPNVAYGVTHLVSNEDWSAGTIGSKKKSSKQLKAESLRIMVISEASLYELMSKGSGGGSAPETSW